MRVMCSQKNLWKEKKKGWIVKKFVEIMVAVLVMVGSVKAGMVVVPTTMASKNDYVVIKIMESSLKGWEVISEKERQSSVCDMVTLMSQYLGISGIQILDGVFVQSDEEALHTSGLYMRSWFFKGTGAETNNIQVIVTVSSVKVGAVVMPAKATLVDVDKRIDALVNDTLETLVGLNGGREVIAKAQEKSPATSISVSILSESDSSGVRSTDIVVFQSNGTIPTK